MNGEYVSLRFERQNNFMDNLHQGKIVLITGTSSGIGLSTAVQFAQQGFTVVATMRDTSKAGSLETQAREAGVSLDVRQLDVQGRRLCGELCARGEPELWAH